MLYRESSQCVRCETECSLDRKRKRGKRKMRAWLGDFLTLRPLRDQMLAGRKRKLKCSTGKVLTACAARPNARWTERGNGERGKWELDREIFSHCVRCETKCSLDERENVSALPGKFSLRPLRDQMLAGQKEETGKKKMGAWPEIFSHCVRCETKCSLDERENVSALPGKFSLRPLRDQMLAGQKERLLK